MRFVNEKVFKSRFSIKSQRAPRLKMHYQRRHIEYTFFVSNFGTFEGILGTVIFFIFYTRLRHTVHYTHEELLVP